MPERFCRQDTAMTYAFPRNASHRLRACSGLVLIFCAGFVTPAICAAAAPTAIAVDIKMFAYAPKEITVAPGTRIVWTNHDGTPHTVTSSDKSFASKGLDTDDKFEHTFASEGDFSYTCTLHPFMTAVVHVRKQSPNLGAKSSSLAGTTSDRIVETAASLTSYGDLFLRATSAGGDRARSTAAPADHL
jgi:plastocyanin